jgi:hypothetical protein
MQERTREQFSLVANEVRQRHGPGVWVDMGAEGSIDEVESRVWAVVEPSSEGLSEVGRLWC